MASRGEPPRRSQLTEGRIAAHFPAKFRGFGPGDRQKRIDLAPEAGPDGFEPHEGQQPVGGIQARRAAAAEDGDEGRVAQRRLSEPGAAHAALLDEGLDGLPAAMFGNLS